MMINTATVTPIGYGAPTYGAPAYGAPAYGQTTLVPRAPVTMQPLPMIYATPISSVANFAAVPPLAPMVRAPILPAAPPVVPTWMPPPTFTSDCPRGLEYLSVIDQLVVQEQLEPDQVLRGYEANHKYVIRNALGQRVYFAVEDSDCCNRNCCGSSRSFRMKLLDNAGTEVMYVQRPYSCGSCCSCCCPCCLEELTVYVPPGERLGTIKQISDCEKPYYSILDAEFNSVLHVRGPPMSCRCCCCCKGDLVFNVLSRDETVEVGAISKNGNGLSREAFKESDIFGVNFPLDMTVAAKATLLGAVFLIDFMYFDN